MGSFFLSVVGNLDVVFSALLNRAVAGTLLLLAACAYRLMFPKAPKWSRLALWALAGVRLALPFSITSVFSLVPSETILDYRTAQYAAKPEITSGIAALNRAVNPAFGESFAASPQGSVNPLQIAMSAAGCIWAVGVAVMLVWTLISFLRLHQKVRVSVESEPGVRLCDAIDTPFLLGLLRPVIYLPSDLEPAEQSCVLAHERAHLRHGDCVWKLLGFFIVCAYWFYLPVWLSYALFCRDLELACDERVVRNYSLQEKKQYAGTLLACSVPRGHFSVCPLAFGEIGVKERVKRILDKKPAKIMIVFAVALCLVIGACFATSRKQAQGYGLSAGTYAMATAQDAPSISPSVSFRMSGGRHEFVFSLSVVSSYYMAGSYTIEDGVVTCTDGTYTLVFRIRDYDTIVLQIPGQDGLSMDGVFLPNGSEFTYQPPDDSRLIFYRQDSTADRQRADFRVSFGEELQYGKVWAELWQDGVCERSAPLELQKTDEALHLSFAYTSASGGEAPKVALSMQAGTAGAVQHVFEMPEQMMGFGFNSYDDGEELPLWDTEELVLASLIPDLGVGVWMYDCQSLSADPVLYQDASCALVVKAVFGTASSLR